MCFFCCAGMKGIRRSNYQVSAFEIDPYDGESLIGFLFCDTMIQSILVYKKGIRRERGEYRERKTFNDVVALMKTSGFVFQGSEIYGGLANTWDYGPLGVELKNNIKMRGGRDSSKKASTMLVSRVRS